MRTERCAESAEVLLACLRMIATQKRRPSTLPLRNSYIIPASEVQSEKQLATMKRRSPCSLFAFSISGAADSCVDMCLDLLKWPGDNMLVEAVLPTSLLRGRILLYEQWIC